jgi:peptidoglycan-associated lipoprotein
MVLLMPSSTASHTGLRAALAAALLCAALPRAAADDPSLELSYGPDETGWLTLRSLRVVLDGRPLQLAPPSRADDPARPLLRAPLFPGAHKLVVEAGLEGDSAVFTYVEGHLFTMRGVLQVEVLPGDVVAVRARVVAQPGVTVQWQDRFRLALDATVRHTQQAEVAAVPTATATPASASTLSSTAAHPETPTPAPAPMAIPTPAAAPARPVRPPAPACALQPVRFAFGQATLTAEGEAALDRLAACLSRSGRTVRLEGHTDGLGSPAYNEWLGTQRAAAAARRLRLQGVAPERITVRSLSAASPACAEGGPGCNARNRRVEALVLE